MNADDRWQSRTAGARAAIAGLALLVASTAAWPLSFPLPPTGETVVGGLEKAYAQFKDTLWDIARDHNLGFREVALANADLDPWIPGDGAFVRVPKRFILPDGPWQDIVINLPEMRLYYYPVGKGEVVTYPIGIGREGWATPIGSARIVSKTQNPTWTPPASVRAEHAQRGDTLPSVVPAGPDNPLGAFAMRLTLPSILIHGTNRPLGVGMRVSHGCMRLYPEDIAALYPRVSPGTQVRIVNQPFKAGWKDGVLFLEVHPPLSEESASPRHDSMAKVRTLVTAEAQGKAAVDWQRVSAVVREQAGLPSPVAGPIERVAAAEELGAVRDEREWLLSLGPLFEGELANRVRESVARLALPMQSSKEGRFGVKLTIGPFASRATATEAQMQIQQETGFEPKVSWSQPNR